MTLQGKFQGHKNMVDIQSGPLEENLSESEERIGKIQWIPQGKVVSPFDFGKRL